MVYAAIHMSENTGFHNMYYSFNYTNYTYIVLRISKGGYLPNEYYTHMQYIWGKNVFKISILILKLLSLLKWDPKILFEVLYIILISVMFIA